MTKKRISKILMWTLAILICLVSLLLPSLLYPYCYDRFLVSGVVSLRRFENIFLKFAGQDYPSTSILSYLNWSQTTSSSEFLGWDLSVYWLLQGQSIEWALWLSTVMSFLLKLIQLLMMGVIVYLVICIFLRGELNVASDTFSRSSKAGLAYEKFIYVFLPSLKGWFIEFWTFFKTSFLWPFFVTIFLFGFNLISYALDLFSVYFYFMFCFDGKALLDFLLATIVSIFDSLSWLPLWAFLLALYPAFCAFRKARGDSKLRQLLSIDKQVVASDTGVFTLILGKMRGGKTTLATSMSRISEEIYRDNCLDNINRIKSYFPQYDYPDFEKDLFNAMTEDHLIVNLVQAAAFSILQNKKTSYYGYSKKFPLAHFDGSVSLSLEDALCIYAESFFVYSMPSSLIAGNIPVRDDYLWMSKGHFPLWDYDLISRDNSRMWDYSSLSHDIAFDCLRFGKKVNPNSPFKYAGGPGVYLFTEFGKEYGNQLTNGAVKATDDESNSKNDLLSLTEKLGGHLANIWHENLFKTIADEQRSGSLASDLVDIAQSVFTADPKTTKKKLALPFYWVEPVIHDFFLKVSEPWLLQYRFSRDDKSLVYCFVNSIRNGAFNHENAVFNRYGYKEMALSLQSTGTSGDFEKGDSTRYFILNYVDFADRFESACMKDFLNEGKKDAKLGFFDLPTFNSLMPTKAEWDFQGSHLVNDLEHPEQSARYRSRRPSKESVSQGVETPLTDSDGRSKSEGGITNE